MNDYRDIIYQNGHMNAVKPTFFMYNGQRYNAAYLNGNIVFGIEHIIPPEPPTTTPFYIESLGGSHTITFLQHALMTTPNIEWSRDLYHWVGSGYGAKLLLEGWERIYFRCDIANFSKNAGVFYIEITPYSSFNTVKIGGNILSLVYGEQFVGKTTFKENGAYQFAELFVNNTAIVDASELSLHMTSLTEHCYQSMFYGCTNLIKGPTLPATTLAANSYRQMFFNCNNLNNIKCLATNLSANDCLTNWMYGVSNTGTFYKKSGVTWPTGINGIPTGWTVVDV